MSSLQKKLIFKKYRFIKWIDKSKNTRAVYEGINELTKEHVAIKCEKIGGKYDNLESEAYTLLLLKSFGIPKLITYGRISCFRVLIEELLGKTIRFVFNKLINNKNKLNDICLFAIQCIDRLEFIHSKNLIHRDIKPPNFLIGRKDPNVIYLIDFGAAKKYRSSRTGKHIKYIYTNMICGSVRYMSINGNRGYEQSRRDDLESLGYTLIELLTKKLPWVKLENSEIDFETNCKKISDLKYSITPEELPSGLPKQFAEYIKYCRNLEFEQKPNYNYLRNLFIEIINSNIPLININIFISSMQFSWMAKMKDNKNDENSWKDFYIRSNILNKIIKRKESCKHRLYKKITGSIEKKKSIEEPKIINDNFYKCNIKNINIIVSDANSNLDNYNNTMRNNTLLNENCISKNINISKEKIRQNTIDYNNQIFDKRQTKKVENTYKTKTIDSFNQTKNFLTKTKNIQSMDLTNINSEINKNYIRLLNRLNIKKLKPQKYKTLIERSKTKESEKNSINSNVKYKNKFNLKLDNYLQNMKKINFKKKLFSDPNII